MGWYNRKYWSVLIVLVFGLGIVMTGCSNKISSIGPDEMETVQDVHNLNILTIDDVDNSLQKLISVSKMIRRDEGGILQLDYKIKRKTEEKDVKVKITLTIAKKSIPEDLDMVMAIESSRFLGTLDVTFGPHGTIFSKPAELDIEIEGLDLAKINVKKLKLYYDNQLTGKWEVMECEKISYDKDKLKLKVEEGKLPHFSRYALAHSE